MKRFSMIAYSGATLEPLFWDRMVIDIDGIQTGPRLPALREHIRDRAVGVIDRTSKRGGKFNAEGYFLSTKDGQEVKQLASEGFPWQASVGIFPLKVEKVSNDEIAQVNSTSFKGPGVIWRESRVREVSFVSLGMDENTSVAVAASAQAVSMATALEAPSVSAPDKELGQRALELSKQEGISYQAAVNRVLNADRDLAARYFKTFHPKEK
jgi:hypothetical protein